LVIWSTSALAEEDEALLDDEDDIFSSQKDDIINISKINYLKFQFWININKMNRMDYSLGRFRFLVENPKRKSKEPSLIKTFKGKQNIIRNKLIIIWSQKSYAYYVFDSISNLIEFLNLTPKDDLHYHEVIFQEAPQRARLDIDDGDEIFFKKVIKALKEITSSKIVVCDQSSSNYFSRHIIVDEYFPSMKDAKNEIVDQVIKLLGGNEEGYIDLNVYHAIQNFRLVGSSKTGKNQPVKKIITRGASFEDSLIGLYRVSHNEYNNR